MSNEEVLKRPDCMSGPSVGKLVTGRHKGQTIHDYEIPEEAQDVIDALQWMMTEYDEVHIDYGENYGLPFAHMCGYVRSSRHAD